MRALIGSLIVAASLLGAGQTLADEPTVTFATSDQPIFGPSGAGDFTTQAGDDIYQDGDYATGNVYVGETKVGSGYVNSYFGAPSAYAKAYARGDSSGTAHAFVSWEIQGTLGPIPTIATGIPVLLNGDAYLDYDSATGPYAGQSQTTGTGTFAHSSASITLSGVTDNQNFFCGGALLQTTPQSCGDNAVSDDFRLLPTSTPGLYQGYVVLIVDSTVVDDLGIGSTNSYTDFDTKDATASIDPTVTIDSSFYALHPGATLTFNPIVGNNGNPQGLPIPPSVPEPETWALMILGVGLAGAGLRRRRGASAKLSRA